MMTNSEILEIGQEDFLVILEDYRIARLSWLHFKAAYGELDTPSHPVRDAINDAEMGEPFDYLLNGLMFDVVLALARLSDERPARGRSDRVTLLILQSHLREKREMLSDIDLLNKIDAANSLTKRFRTDTRIERIRDRRNTHLAHRLRMKPSDLKYGELEDALNDLTTLFEMLAPLFRASKGFPETIPSTSDYSIQRFWNIVRIGAISGD